MPRTLIAFVLVALGGCVPPLPGGTLEDGAGNSGAAAGGAANTGMGGLVKPPVGQGGAPLNTGSAGSQGAGPGGSSACAPAACTEQPQCASSPSWTGSPVSSFETACGAVDAVVDRDGGWFIYTTANSIASPGPTEPFRVACDGADDSCYSACVSGTLAGNGRDWPTVGLGFSPRANAAAYDASRYSAIGFWMRADVGPESTLRLLVPLKADTAVGTGDGTCTTGCFDAYNVVLRAADEGPFPLPGWQHISVPFSALRQQGFGAPEPWDPATVISFQWSVAATTTPNLLGDRFTICVDQVELLP
jgi:hypothetical protein